MYNYIGYKRALSIPTPKRKMPRLVKDSDSDTDVSEVEFSSSDDSSDGSDSEDDDGYEEC